MTIWSVIKNIGFIIALFKDVKNLIQHLVEKKELDCLKSDKVLSRLQDACERKVVDLPGIDESEVALAIQDVRKQLTCNIPVRSQTA